MRVEQSGTPVLFVFNIFSVRIFIDIILYSSVRISLSIIRSDNFAIIMLTLLPFHRKRHRKEKYMCTINSQIYHVRCERMLCNNANLIEIVPYSILNVFHVCQYLKNININNIHKKNNIFFMAADLCLRMFVHSI